MITVLDVLFLTLDARPLALVFVTCRCLMWPRSSIVVEGAGWRLLVEDASWLCLAWLVVAGVGADVAAEQHH